MAIYDPNSNQHNNGSDIEVNLIEEDHDLNCLEFALGFWFKNPRYKIYYDSDHAINLLEYPLIKNFLPIENFGLEHFLNSFLLKPKYIDLLKIYFKTYGR